MKILLMFLAGLISIVLIIGLAWLVYRHETNPKTKHNPPDPDGLKCNNPWNNRWTGF